MGKTVSVIISTYHSKSLDMVLDRLQYQTFQDFEVIVTDDGSQDFKHIKEYPYEIKYVWHKDIGRTWSKAHNEAMRLSTGKYMFILHDDILPKNDLIEQFMKLADENMVITGIRPTIPRTEEAYKDPEKHIMFEDHRITLNRGHFDELGVNLEDEEIVDVDLMFNNPYAMVSGCLLWLPSHHVKEIGMCAEDMPGWGREDYDLCMRLMRNGCKIIMGLKCIGYHLDHEELTGPEVEANAKWIEVKELTPGYLKNFNYGE